eukprot:5349210-Alexandrium_andersonii.AAC.1
MRGRLRQDWIRRGSRAAGAGQPAGDALNFATASSDSAASSGGSGDSSFQLGPQPGGELYA